MTRRLLSLIAIALCGQNGDGEAAAARPLDRPGLAELPLLSDLLRAERVCSLTNTIAVGMNLEGGPSLIVEVVTHVGKSPHAVWRGAHYPVAVAEAAAVDGGRIGFDVFDADADTLTLRSSAARWETLNAFRVEHGEVIRHTSTGTDGEPAPAERFSLGGARPLPEGPGTPILVQAVPWSESFRARAVYLDRWRREGEARLHEALVEVTGETRFRVARQMLPVWEVRTEAPGAYTIHQLVTKNRPHRVVRTDYRSAPGAEPLISEVVGYTDGPGCAAGSHR